MRNVFIQIIYTAYQTFHAQRAPMVINLCKFMRKARKIGFS